MCIPMRSCLFCINLDTATKIIAVIYVMVSTLLSALYLVPLVALGDQLPLERMYFYSSLTIFSVSLFFTSCLLIYAEYREKAKLMWPWVSTAWCTSVPLGVLCVLGMVTVAFRAEDVQEATTESAVISVYFTHAMLLFYCACVVHSRRIQLVEEYYARANKRLMYPIMYHVNSV